jgi:hypothetical protein
MTINFSTLILRGPFNMHEIYNDEIWEEIWKNWKAEIGIGCENRSWM